VCGTLVVLACWNDWLDARIDQMAAERIGVIGAIQNQSFGFGLSLVPQHFLDGSGQPFQCGRGTRLDENSERSTRAIGPYHKLASLAALGFAHLLPPSFAIPNVPSTKHSLQRRCCLSLSCRRNARHRFKSVSSLAH
jgi:hypothetical protein